jgi:hypothetical protein
MQKRILGVVLFWIMMIVHPGQAAFEGFRVGGILGMQLLAGRHWYTGTPSPRTDMVQRLSSLSGLYGVHAGYLAELGNSKVVVGGEVYAFIPQATPKINLALFNNGANSPVEGTVTVNHNRSIGFVATVGMMFNPKILGYLSAGIELAKFRFTYAFNSLVSPPLPSQQILNHTFKAINIALGGSYKFGPHFLVGLEISSPFFKRFKANMTAPRAYHYKPVERRMMIKLTYLF